MNEVFYSGWKHLGDGEEAEIYRTDYALRGIVAPRGEQKAEFCISQLQARGSHF